MILDNLRGVRTRIETAAQRSGRSLEEVTLVAVTKKASPEAVAELLKSGWVKDIGESRVQDAARKAEALRRFSGLPRISWRMIGHLQTNKARTALDVFDAVDSVDSLRLAATLDTRLAGLDRKLPVLLQVKLAERETQSGVAPEAVKDFLESCRLFQRLDIRGLMAIAPNVEPVEGVRPYFKRLKLIFDQCFSKKEGMILSMGMSRDFEIAVEEGSTMVRIGTALFT